jgi:hypothetical protein
MVFVFLVGRYFFNLVWLNHRFLPGEIILKEKSCAFDNNLKRKDWSDNFDYYNEE